jgi:hypothetical protein
MSRARRLTVASLGVLACCLHAGCMLPYAYPRLAHVGGVEVERQGPDVHAFRVDARVSLVDISHDVEEYRLGRVPLTGDGRVPSFDRVEVDYGLYVVGGALNYPIHHHRQTEMRLYRPGSQLLNLGPGGKSVQVSWRPAVGLAGQEKAVDDLLAPPVVPGALLPALPERPWSLSKLAPGSASPAQRDALLFAAAEYDRLAAAFAADAPRLAGKAKAVRDLATR